MPSPSERRPCVRAMRVHVATIRRPRQAIRRRQCAPFSRLLYVFPPLLRILCRNKFFLRRIKILERHSEYLARARGDIDVPGREQNDSRQRAATFLSRAPSLPPSPLSLPFFPCSRKAKSRKGQSIRRSCPRRDRVAPLAGVKPFRAIYGHLH